MHDFTGAKSVISAQRLAELSQRRNAPALWYLASHFGALGANSLAMYWTWGTWWCLPFFALQGVLINFLYAPEHECDHFTAFESRWLNVWVARVCGFIIVLTNDDHRWSHYHHHRNTQDWEEDPEIRYRGELRTARQYLGALLGYGSFWRERIKPMLTHALGRAPEPWLTGAQRRSIIASARWHLAGYTLIAVSAVAMKSWWPLYYWLGPYLVMRWTYWLQGLGEHTCLTHAPCTLLNTRTFRTNAFMRWVNWNMTYHTVHHTYPSVPFYRLPALHREVEGKLGFELPTESYLALHWRHLKALAAGKTELDLCAEHDARVRGAGRLEAAA